MRSQGLDVRLSSRFEVGLCRSQVTQTRNGMATGGQNISGTTLYPTCVMIMQLTLFAEATSVITGHHQINSYPNPPKHQCRNHNPKCKYESVQVVPLRKKSLRSRHLNCTGRRSKARQMKLCTSANSSLNSKPVPTFQQEEIQVFHKNLQLLRQGLHLLTELGFSALVTGLSLLKMKLTVQKLSLLSFFFFFWLGWYYKPTSKQTHLQFYIYTFDVNFTDVKVKDLDFKAKFQKHKSLKFRFLN